MAGARGDEELLAGGGAVDPAVDESPSEPTVATAKENSFYFGDLK
jgi:hypothetical protein